jgi:Disulphide bond corrector protein DsbC
VRFRIGALVLLLAGGLAIAQNLPWETGDSADKKPQSVRFLYPEQISVTANHDSIVEMHFKVNDGLHINSHTPRIKSLIPTQLMVVEPAGLKIGPVDFPAGTDYSFAATPNDKIAVYTGEFVVKAHIKAQAGEHLIQGALRYQACDTNSCYPPRNAPVAMDVIAR